MWDNWSIDERLVKMAIQQEQAITVEGRTAEGLPILVVVVTGANVGLFKQYCGEVLPGIAVTRGERGSSHAP